jgi:hypothetical protein
MELNQMAKANNKLSRFAKRHYEAIAEAMQEAYGSIDHDGPASDLVRAGINKARAACRHVRSGQRKL